MLISPNLFCIRKYKVSGQNSNHFLENLKFLRQLNGVI
jgi:hypothetical protein